jgi:D-alanyl-D-alanine carboxypeptidase/D-alanyl-D-alanine-endopeptidase (penicillin-binding protein 4)
VSDKDEPKTGAGKSSGPAWPAVDSDAGSAPAAEPSTPERAPSKPAQTKPASSAAAPAWPDTEPAEEEAEAESFRARAEADAPATEAVGSDGQPEKISSTPSPDEPRPAESAQPGGRRHQLRVDDEAPDSAPSRPADGPRESQRHELRAPTEQPETPPPPRSRPRPGTEWTRGEPAVGGPRRAESRRDEPQHEQTDDQPTLALPRPTPRPTSNPTPQPKQRNQPARNPYPQQERREREQHTQVLPVINEQPTEQLPDASGADDDTDRGIPVRAAYTAKSPLDAPTERQRLPVRQDDTAPADDDYENDGYEDHDDHHDAAGDEAAGDEHDEERAHPMRISPTGEDGHDEPPKRRKRKGLLLSTGAVFVVILLAIGALIGVPGLADRLGVPLPGVVKPTAAPPSPVVAKRQVTPLAATAPQTTAQGVSAALAKVTANPKLATLTGTVIDPRSGDTVWSKSPTTPLAPGSTQKLLTAAAVLLSVDHTKTFQTRVVQGATPGTAVLVGGGDPTINSLPAGQDSVYWNSAHLSDLVDQVRKSSGGKIKSVSIDQSRYTGETAAPGWDKRDIKGGDWAPIVPAMLDGGRHDPTKAEGTPRTNNPGGDLLGKFATGIGATPGGAGKAPANGKVLGQISSAPVSDLVANMLTESDNVLTETMGRELAIANGAPPTFDGATKTVLKVLREKGFDTTGASMHDCSGLSTLDKLPASLIQSVLRTAAAPDGSDPRTAQLAPILDGLPVAGGTGTLGAGGRYQKGPSAPGKGWVRAKTGTLNNVNALAGLVQDVDGRMLAFVFMSNGSTADQARPALDAIAAKLRDCGCH